MIYIHIPYCHHKCTYCAFYSQAGKHDTQEYVEALCQEITSRSVETGHAPSQQVQSHSDETGHAPSLHRVRTVYFGGGTPSLLELRQLEQIINRILEYFDLSQVEECTLEANPEDISAEYCEGLLRLGFNRLSLGVQSFHDSDLRTLNRVHSAQQALNAIAIAQKAGFDNISVDLIYGLPNQSLEDWRENLRQAQQVDVQHLSCYALTVEEGTMLDRQIAMGRVRPASEDLIAEEYNVLCDWAQEAGFEQYEISNFCRPGYHSRHNSRYWDRTPYMGFGAAAHSFDGQKRRWNIPFLPTYLSQEDYYEEEELTLEDAHNEYVMTALRTTAGIEKGLLPYPDHLARAIHKYIVEGLIEETPTHYRPTREGLLHADGIAADCFLL